MRLHPRLWNLLTSKTTRRVFILTPFLGLAGVFLFYLCVNLWGAHRLQNIQERLAKKGYLFSYSEVLRTNLPEEADFNRHSIATRRTRLRTFEHLQGKGYDQMALADWHADSESGLKASALKLRHASNEAEAARLILADLAELDEEAKELAQALADCDGMSVKTRLIEGNFSLHSPEIEARRSLLFFNERAALKALAGDPEGAMTDLAVTPRFLELQMRHPKPLMTAVTANNMLNFFANTCWQIAALPTTPESDLHQMMAWLADSEQKCATVHHWKLHAPSTCQEHFSVMGPATAISWENMDWSFDTDFSNTWKSTLHAWWWQIRPVGFMKAELADSLLHLHHNLLHQPDGSPRTTWDHASYQTLAERVKSAKPISTTVSYLEYHPVEQLDVLARLLAENELIRTTRLRLTRIAIAAELHRRATGSPPDSLHDLSPNYFPEIPVNPWSGQPFELKAAADGIITLTAPSPKKDLTIHLPTP